jgi:divalent metal cation (Fe/Co/Zn/Cd) transporter
MPLTGALVGAFVGFLVGAFVGFLVGALVGALVGFLVGAIVIFIFFDFFMLLLDSAASIDKTYVSRGTNTNWNDKLTPALSAISAISAISRLRTRCCKTKKHACVSITTQRLCSLSLSDAPFLDPFFFDFFMLLLDFALDPAGPRDTLV